MLTRSRPIDIKQIASNVHNFQQTFHDYCLFRVNYRAQDLNGLSILNDLVDWGSLEEALYNAKDMYEIYYYALELLEDPTCFAS